MTEFDQGWAVMRLDAGEREGDPLAVVDVLRVYRSEQAARVEVYRRRGDDTNQDHLYFYEETEIERAG